MTIGDVADRVPVGAVADQVGGEDRPRARADHRLDLRDVDLERIGLHVDEGGDDPAAHERRDVAREGERRRDHLVAGLAPEEVDGEPQRRCAAVHHHAMALREQLRDAALELVHPRPELQRAVLEHVDDRGDLTLVVDRPRLGDGMAPHVTHV